MFDLFATRLPWHWLARFIAFWLITFAVATILYRVSAPLSGDAFARVFLEALRSDYSRLSTEPFAYSLAWAIAAAASGLLAAFCLLHAFLPDLALRAATRIVRRTKSKDAFSDDYERIHRVMARHPLLGHAWTEFDETLVKTGPVLRNTLRPQAFFNYATLKEKLWGLKIMPAIPGYFVGTGLFLTFVGLVFALSKAAAGAEAAHAAVGGAGAEAMQGALRELLEAATFKFSTSIAGLGASIALSLFFRLFVVGLEASLGAFSEALEEKLDYVAPQSVTLEMVAKLDGQLAELKGINSDKFFSRLGEEVAPSIRSALHGAIEPLAARIDDAVGQMAAKSQSGVDELLSRFSESVQGGAGAELRELAIGLKTMQTSLEKVGADLSGSGEDFARKIAAAAENLDRLVGEAGQSLGRQSERSREAMEGMLRSLHEVFDHASRKIDENLAGAAESASGRLEQAMERVLGQMGSEMGALRETFGGFRESAATYVAETSAKVAEAQASSVEAVSVAAAKAAEALDQGLGKALEDIRREVETFSAVLRNSSASLAAQTSAMENIARSSREAADLFGRSADAVRGAVEPVTRSNEKLLAATESVREALGRCVASLGESQKAATMLAETLSAQTTRLTKLWDDYEERFGKVDEDLGRAFEKLAVETRKQSEILADRTTAIDRGFASSIDKLQPFLKELGDGAGELAEAVQTLEATLSNFNDETARRAAR